METVLEVPKPIWIIEPDAAFRTVLKRFLLAQGFEVRLFESVLSAFLEGEASRSITLVVAESALGEESYAFLLKGEETFQWASITTFRDKPFKEETTPLSHVSLERPFKRLEFMSALQWARIRADTLLELKMRLTQPRIQTDPEASEAFVRIDVDDCFLSPTLPKDLFIRLENGQFLKWLSGGESLQTLKLKSLKEKGFDTFYFLTDDRDQYAAELVALMPRILKSQWMATSDKVLPLLVRITHVAVSQLFYGTLTADSFARTQQACLLLEGVVHAQKMLPALLPRLRGQRLTEHSMLVSQLALGMARTLGWTSSVSLTKVCMAGLLHDYGKKDWPVEWSGLPENALPRSMQEDLSAHPTHGAALLQRYPFISSDIVQVALEHHECVDKSGYPARLSSKRIHPLARLVAVANEVAHQACSAESDWIEHLLLWLESDPPTFDPTYLQACKECLRRSQDTSTGLSV